MKWTTFALGIALAHITLAGYSQITLKEKNAPLEKVLAAIEQQTHYVFLYDPNDLKIGTITLYVKNATVQETLGKCFKGLPVEFTVVGNNVLLKRIHPENVKSSVLAAIHITGRVVDENGQPLPGVTVINKREIKGTQTDSAGVFTLSVSKGDRLSFSFVGYKEKEISINDQRHFNIALEINPSSPDQVVVIGYGSSKKKDLTGAVSIVDIRNIENIPFNTVDNALAGRAAGVQVTKSDGTPGGMVRVRIRGSSSILGGNDPLYVVDGVPVQVRNNYIDPGFYVGSPAANLIGAFSGAASGAALSASFVNGLNSLAGLDPDNIESVTVLKDASSTAIYGSKAANGVVIITTKTGNTNSSPRMALDYFSTVSSPYKTPRLLNVAQYKLLLTEAAQNAFDEDTARGAPVDPVTAAILGSPSTYFGKANTDWIKKVTRTTVSQNIGFSLAGGGRTSKYFSSIALNNIPGVVDGTDFRRFSGKLNLETAISPKFRVVSNLSLGFTDQNISAGAYAQALLARPDWTPYDAAGNYTDINLQDVNDGAAGFINPVALLTATNNSKTVSLVGSLSGIYAISNAFRFKSTVSLNLQNYNQRNFLPAYIDIVGPNGNEANPNGIGSEANSRFADWFLENTLTYTKQFNQHALNAVIGQSYETTKYSYFRATAAGYPNNTILTGLSSASTPLSVAGDDPGSPQSYLLSFYIRANYSYQDKYLFTFTGRTDGSSKFGPGHKYGYFPSGAIAWRISRENILKKISWIDDVKVRGSYGLTGNQNIGDQMYRTLYSPVGYAGSSALIPTQLGNQGIKWESTREADIGLDMSLFTGRLNACIDYYNRQTGNALLPVSAAANTSYSGLLENVAGLRNRGFEISIGGDIVRSRDFRWTASINITWNHSLVTRLDPQADLSQISPSGLESIASSTNLATSKNHNIGNTALIQGKPLGLITGGVITGLVKTQAQLDAYNHQLGYNTYYYARQIGDPMYMLDTTLASAGYVAPAVGEIIGNGTPSYFGGMTQELGYKNFNLQLYFTFSRGGQLLWAEHVASNAFIGTANADHSILNRYTPANANSNEPRLSLNTTSVYASNLDMFSSSYLKLRSLTFSYRFDRAGWVKRMGLKDVQVFMSATNIFTITKYPGSDPETSDDPYSVNGGYIDAGNYPATKTFSLGLKVAF